MATYHFPIASGSQAFNPASDILNFNLLANNAFDVVVGLSSTNATLTLDGVTIALLGASQEKLTTANIRFANGSLLIIGDNTTDTYVVDNAGDTVVEINASTAAPRLTRCNPVSITR